MGAQAARHPVSDGDAAIAAGIDLVYECEAPHQLCVFHLLRWDSLAEWRKWGRRTAYWRRKALSKGLRHLTTGQIRHRTTSRLGRHNRELRRREKLGTVGTEHNLPALLQNQGLLNQTAYLVMLR